VKQFILGKEPDKDGLVRLEGGDYRYLVRVRRYAVGEFFPAILPNGKETLVQVISINHNTLTGKCSRSDSASNIEASEQNLNQYNNLIPPIILFQAMPKGDKMDLIVRQAAENGITEIVPFMSEFSIGKINARGEKFSRWERIIKEARQQSGSKIATSVCPLQSISDVFDYWKKINETCAAEGANGDGALGVLFHHDRNSVHGGLENNCLHRYLDIDPEIVALVIGPEGGFSDREAALFMDVGFKPVTIGDTVLRTETAAVFCTAAIRILLLERNSWELKQMKPYSA